MYHFDKILLFKNSYWSVCSLISVQLSISNCRVYIFYLFHFHWCILSTLYSLIFRFITTIVLYYRWGLGSTMCQDPRFWSSFYWLSLSSVRNAWASTDLCGVFKCKHSKNWRIIDSQNGLSWKEPSSNPLPRAGMGYLPLDQVAQCHGRVHNKWINEKFGLSDLPHVA